MVASGFQSFSSPASRQSRVSSYMPMIRSASEHSTKAHVGLGSTRSYSTLWMLNFDYIRSIVSEDLCAKGTLLILAQGPKALQGVLFRTARTRVRSRILTPAKGPPWSVDGVAAEWLKRIPNEKRDLKIDGDTARCGRLGAVRSKRCVWKAICVSSNST